MASGHQIQMDFHQAGKQADELDRIAEALKRVSATDLRDTLNKLGNDWRGENADRYIQKGVLLMENMEKTISSLHTAANTIRVTAKNIYNAEMAALRIAQERQAAARADAVRNEAVVPTDLFKNTRPHVEKGNSDGVSSEAIAKEVTERIKNAMDIVTGSKSNFPGGGGGGRF